MTDKRIFKANEIESNRKGWIVDLSPPNIVNPDCYWSFDSKAKAMKFVRLIKKGLTPREAEHKVY